MVGRDNHHNDLTFIDLFHIVLKHLITVVIGFIVVFGLSCVYLLVKTPEYTATAQAFTTYSDTSNVNENYSSLGSAASYISTQVKSYPTLITTDVVLQPVIDQMHLDESIATLAKTITAVNPTNTAFINISASSEDPHEAAKIANAVTDSFQNVVQSSLYMDNKQSPVKITVVQKAMVPESPSAPKTPLVLLIGIVGGLIVGIIAALLKDVLSRKIQDDSELTTYINAPTLGRIPEDEAVNSNTSVIISEPGSSVAEDYRRICTNLSFIAPISGTNSRLVVVSAVGANEGKTTTAVNVATALAETGSAVLLIDADLRNPSVAKKLDIDGSAGLAHVLSGQASVKDVVQRFWKANLHIMPAGPKPPNAAQLLNSPVMSELINNALHQYDYVIIDTAPLVVANDGALFAKQGGGLVMVSRRGVTLKKQLSETAAELANLHVDVTGFVFNGAKLDKKLAGSSYYYYTSSSDSQSKERHSSHSKDKH
ncbi:Chain length regulator (capsular polysaccharide biosynthesis)/Tyrosine-protein kinase (capsular polysaccharide biosynthesis) [Bifidobacterium magnum]|uniref:non-specific protein-tyrosine kinase n=2 Tax=Bifidobacterium magnum TaxID=1692 RepID=A0A087BBC7_9BIFI|nr:Chain length regulator (capsular polysaccharide biosynthesis)/Tyrosine-protein kinase (capsular polysaccharide biosynthesis) [Bifidobacterium magnum]